MESTNTVLLDSATSIFNFDDHRDTFREEHVARGHLGVDGASKEKHVRRY